MSIVIPVYNEEKVLLEFHQALIDELEKFPGEYDYEIWYVAGGSTDATSDIIKNLYRENPKTKLLELSRNYGHQAALTAGLDYARGDIVITMDGDGQPPPQIIPVLVNAYEQGYDLVLTQRKTTEKLDFLSRWLSKTFYRVINILSNSELVPNSSDFRLMSREVVDEFCTMREQHRFIRGMVMWMGYRQTIVKFDAPERLGGESKFTLRRRIKLAGDAIFSFSISPILLVIYAGILLLTFAILYVIYLIIVVLTVGLDNLPPGWASLMLVILSIGGMQLVTTGIIGYYVGLTFQESKDRPVYFVNKRLSTLDDEDK